MELVIDLSSFQAFMDLPFAGKMSVMFWLFGWIPVAAVIIWGAKELWLFYINQQWGQTQKFILLAIDIPRNNIQSPKAVENLLSYLAGAHGTPDLIDKYWVGVYQLSLSLEIVSIDGYTQFLIHLPEKFRDLVESAVYSQYPDAEITEVNDYTESVPSQYPDEEYDLFGVEFILKNPDAYPIKLYKEFEHIFGPTETHFKDPMALLMDLCGSLNRGEQLWYQIILTPIGFDWMEIGDKAVSRILKEAPASKKSIVDYIVDFPLMLIGLVTDALIASGASEAKNKEQDDSLKMMNLKPKEKKQVEAIQYKVSKLGFECKIRFIYAGKKEVFNKPKVVNGFVGYMKQFADLDLNNLKPDMDKTATSVSYFMADKRVNARKRRILYNYKNRDGESGRAQYILNIEELATIWHFPIEPVVKVPMIQKAPGRKAEAPATLPVREEKTSQEIISQALEAPIENIGEEAIAPADSLLGKAAAEPGPEKKGEAPNNLPIG